MDGNFHEYWLPFYELILLLFNLLFLYLILTFTFLWYFRANLKSLALLYLFLFFRLFFNFYMSILFRYVLFLLSWSKTLHNEMININDWFIRFYLLSFKLLMTKRLFHIWNSQMFCFWGVFINVFRQRSR